MTLQDLFILDYDKFTFPWINIQVIFQYLYVYCLFKLLLFQADFNFISSHTPLLILILSCPVYLGAAVCGRNSFETSTGDLGLAASSAGHLDRDLAF